MEHNVLTMFQNKLHVNDIKIMECYRLGKKQTEQNHSRIIKFGSYKYINKVFLNKKKLKNTNLIIWFDSK